MLGWSVAIELQVRPFVLEIQAQWIAKTQLIICTIIKKVKVFFEGPVMYIKDFTKQLSFCRDIFQNLPSISIIIVIVRISLLSFIYMADRNWYNWSMQ